MDQKQRRITRKKRHIASTNTMRTVYGEMILKKGTKLYHVSDFEFCVNPAKSMLFTVFHPSDILDTPLYDEYVTTITLKRDVSLFFMVGNIINGRILPLLDSLIGKPGQNLGKQSDSNLSCYIKYLRAENFDGWFSTINGKGHVEVALINDTSVFEISSCDSFVRNWNNSNYVNNTYIPRRWGVKYDISPITLPVILNINRRYEADIKKYIEYATTKYPNEFIFQLLLDNAIIHYTDYPSAYIRWDC